MEQGDKYMVAVRCMTYNQSLYIEESLHGFTIQETNFPVVYIVVDDASTDGEQDLLRNWAEMHLCPKEGLLLWETMPYGQLAVAKLKGNDKATFVFVLLAENHTQTGRRNLKSEYVSEWNNAAKYNALCEGDDYWIDPLKLAKQVEILESDPEIGLCYASAKVYDEDKHSFSKEIKGHKFETFEQQLMWNYIPTLTVCMRTDMRLQYDAEKKNWEEAKTWKMGDYPLWLWFCVKSKVSFLNDVVAVYRVSPGTASRPKTMAGEIAFVESTYSIKMHFAKMAQTDKSLLLKIKSDRDKGLAYVYINNGDFTNAKIYIKQLPFSCRFRVVLYLIKKRFLG